MLFQKMMHDKNLEVESMEYGSPNSHNSASSYHQNSSPTANWACPSCTTETNSSTITPFFKAKTDASMYFNPLEPAKDPISKNGWNSKSADQILLLLERNTNTILDVSDQHIDDEGLELIHFFFTFNKRLRKLISGFNVLGNKFTNEGFWKFYTAMDILYDKFKLKRIKTYCGKYVQKMYAKREEDMILIDVDELRVEDFYIVGHTLKLNDNNINFLYFGTIDIDKIVPLIIKYLRAKEDDIDFTKFGFLGNWREDYKKNSSIPITYDYEYTMIRYVKRGKRSSEQQNILDEMHYANERHDIIYGVRDKLIDKKQREEEHITYDKRIERESQEEEVFRQEAR
jgi:hypothetical protein